MTKNRRPSNAFGGGDVNEQADVALRAVAPTDLDTLVRISTGPIAGKRAFIVDSFGRRTMIAACIDARVVGYMIWDRAFFGRPFIWLLGVDANVRRLGIATRLVHEFLRACGDEPVFTSTNESNTGMQQLLLKAGFCPSGRVENLDPGDAELFYFKSAAAKEPG